MHCTWINGSCTLLPQLGQFTCSWYSDGDNTPQNTTISSHAGLLRGGEMTWYALHVNRQLSHKHSPYIYIYMYVAKYTMKI